MSSLEQLFSTHDKLIPSYCGLKPVFFPLKYLKLFPLIQSKLFEEISDAASVHK